MLSVTPLSFRIQQYAATDGSFDWGISMVQPPGERC